MVGLRRELVLSSQNVPVFVRHVRARHGDADAIIRRFGLKSSVEQSREAELALPDLHAFGTACADAVGDPDFGVSTAEWAPRGAFGLLEFACRSAATVGGGLEGLVRFHAILNDPTRVRLESTQTESRLDFFLPKEPLCWGRHFNECCLVLLCRIAREVSGGVCVPERVWFAHARPSSVNRLVEALGCSKISFGEGKSGLAIQRKLLDAPLLSADDALLRTLEEQVASRIDWPSADREFMGKLRERIGRQLSSEVRIEVVASGLNMSVRTLQRRLAAEGTSFQATVESVRHARAQVLLLEPGRAIKSIACALGYSETSAFARAYKRATGMTPGEARRRSEPSSVASHLAR